MPVESNIEEIIWANRQASSILQRLVKSTYVSLRTIHAHFVAVEREDLLHPTSLDVSRGGWRSLERARRPILSPKPSKECQDASSSGVSRV